jgi:hypothetical protein
MAMGRRSYHLPREQRAEFSGRVYLRKIRLDSGGYDEFGSYFGHSRAHGSVYEYEWQESGAQARFGAGREISSMLRAHSRDQAKVIVRQTYPRAKFFN